MPNLSQIKREKMISFLEKLRETCTDDSSIIAINEIENELTNKKYGLVWEKHEENVDIMMRSNIPVFTEKIENRIVHNPDDKYNFLLEGDNLHSLYLLDKIYHNKIDVIYIDPPYNTENDEFLYNDVIVSKEDAYRHSKWISAMNERLKYAHSLLKNDGCIFISINENEVFPLKLLCDEIFGENNYLTTFAVRVRHDDRILKRDKPYHEVFEYLLLYRKSPSRKTPKILKDNTSIDEYIWKITELKEPSEIVKMGTKNVAIFRPDEYKIEKIQPSKTCLKSINIRGSIKDGNSSGRFFMKYLDKYMGDKLGYLYRVEGMGDDDLGFRYFQIPDKSSRKNGTYFQGVPTNNSDIKEIPYPNLLNFVDEFNFVGDEGGVIFRNGKKPIAFLHHIFELAGLNTGEKIVLDFFAGSGTTGHALLSYNSMKNTNHHFILCTNNEKNICRGITYPRLKKVATGKNEDGSQFKDYYPTNLMYYTTDFIPKTKELISDSLLEHIKEMIQLEYGVSVDNSKHILVLSDTDADMLEKNWNSMPSKEAIYISRSVMLTTSQKKLFSCIKTYTIPDYYFNNELREVGESW